MNREQRRQTSKNMGMPPSEPMNLTAIMVQFDNGKAMYLDINLVEILDKQTRQPLFREVLEPINASLPSSVTDQQPAATNVDNLDSYRVEFDTPEGRMEYVKNGDWSGVRKVKQ